MVSNYNNLTFEHLNMNIYTLLACRICVPYYIYINTYINIYLFFYTNILINLHMYIARPVHAFTGDVLVFPHGSTEGSLLHEGSAVLDTHGECQDVKYVIRTDVLYLK